MAGTVPLYDLAFENRSYTGVDGWVELLLPANAQRTAKCLDLNSTVIPLRHRNFATYCTLSFM